MNQNKYPILLLLVSALAFFSGCFGTSPAARFYTLSPVETGQPAVNSGLDVAVLVGPVTIPDYLDRRQIMTRSGRNELVLAEFDRWGGSLDSEITRVLIAGLGERLAPLRIAVLPWRGALLSDARRIYRIPVTVSRFDGTLDETVVLHAAWGVAVKEAKQEETLFATESTITEEVKGEDYGALAAAMGRAVDTLGKEIAERISVLNERRKD
ncbi:MAG: membrane integrity-associated transporter subunit PqiC [Deltaproteobacteria bacterium]|nr:membrane integrity-associated transporter subunit PqiC [Deltaproteobacteria bacterium]TLN04916.1 MAG: membrane integrity-associated transporter subunit PqiC [bacterium]